MKNLIMLFTGIIGLTLLGLTLMNAGVLSSKPSEVVVEVVYGRKWAGSITVNGIEESWEGDGVSLRILTRPENADKWEVEVSAQKRDSSLDWLTISIWDSKGELLKSMTTTTPFQAIYISVIL